MSRPQLTPGKDPVPIVQEAGWASGPVWTGVENLAPQGFDPRTVQPIGSRNTDYATRPNLQQMLPAKLHLIYRNVHIYVTEQNTKSYAVGLGVGLTTHPNISLRLGMTIAITLHPTLCLHGRLLGDIFIQLGPLVVLVSISERGLKLLRFLVLPNNLMKMA